MNLVSACTSLFFVHLFLLHAGPAYPSGLELIADLDKESYTKKDAIRITFKLENKGKKAVLVNKRFYLGSPGMSKRQRDLYLEVTAPSGKRLPCKFTYAAGYPKSDWFHSLEPGKTVHSERGARLKGYYDFDESGSYTIRAYYDNAFGPEIGLDAFGKKIASQTVRFELSE